jgi:hypothetical protein
MYNAFARAITSYRVKLSDAAAEVFGIFHVTSTARPISGRKML